MKIEVYQPMKDAVPLTATPEGRRTRAEMIVEYYNGGSTLNEKASLIQEIENLNAYMAINCDRIGEKQMAE